MTAFRHGIVGSNQITHRGRRAGREDRHCAERQPIAAAFSFD